MAPRRTFKLLNSVTTLGGIALVLLNTERIAMWVTRSHGEMVGSHPTITSHSILAGHACCAMTVVL